MTKKQLFNMQVAESVSAQLGEEVIVSISKTNKVNLTLDGLIIRRKEESTAPVIYLDPYFNRFKAGIPMESIVDDIITIYNDTIQNTTADQFLVESFQDFDSIKDMIILTVINTERNQALLSDVPSVPVDGLRLSAIFSVVSISDERTSAVIIKNEHLEYWGKDMSDLIPLAEENTNRLLNFTVRSLYEVLPELLESSEEKGEDGKENYVKNIDTAYPPFYILTDQYAMFGASQLYFRDKIRDFALQQGCDVYILPSSIHELILITVRSFGVEGKHVLKRMVMEVNATAIMEGDFLYDGAFKYLLSEDRIVEL